MTFNEWRHLARQYLAAGVVPDDSLWTEHQGGLFAPVLAVNSAPQLRVPRAFLETAGSAACHSDQRRWALLYRLIYRLTHGEPHLLEIDVDSDVALLNRFAREVNHDAHRMKAFVRFRKVQDEAGEHYIAWHQPDHDVVERTAPWFRDRFGGMRWTILTPVRSVSWDLETLRYGPGVPSPSDGIEDSLEDLWRTYYGAVFNPARVSPEGLARHIPKRYWPALPETDAIPELIRTAELRVVEMAARSPRSAAPYIPAAASLSELREAVHSCRGCDLYRCATQPVFGEGPENARLMFVGEQPGDNEDREGRPFVGPAGQMFDQAMAEAGLERGLAYITGAVKHFKFEERGKRRIHKTANRAEVAACQPWLSAQIAAVRPKLIVAMGATAALSVTGRRCSVLEERGRFNSHASGASVLITVHPSFLLRMPDPELQRQQYALFVDDLRQARTFLQASSAAVAASVN